MKAKVFVSSTVYDLIDVRAELEGLIRDMGLDPILSDSATSNFEVKPDTNSIETCLANVRSSDYVLVILSQRYGPSLGKDFGDVSATHLEYKEAMRSGKHVFFYVRDRLEADYAIWRKSRDKGALDLRWVKEKDDYGLFDVMKEHRHLQREEARSNWCQTFQSSIDLKALVARDLHLPAAKASLERAVLENRIPMFRGEVALPESDSTAWANVSHVVFTNRGTVPAYNIKIHVTAVTATHVEVEPAIPPAGSFPQMVFPQGGLLESPIVLEYLTPEGHRITDTFDVRVYYTHVGVESHAILRSKQYSIGNGLPFEIVGGDSL